MVFINASVRKNQNIHAISVSSVHFHKQMVKGSLQRCVDIIGNRNRRYLEAFNIHRLNLQQICIGQNRIVNLYHLAVLCLFLQKIAVRSDINGCGCDDFLTNGIDRRIRYLGKHLFKIGK